VQVLHLTAFKLAA